jgi:catechol 2,3-dioxygenase-like lactoylglutathione lyase family enzyme
MDWKLEVVVIPVSDVDRSKQFYTEQAGFHLDVDHRGGESMRVVQVTPPGSACSVSFGTGLVQMEPGSVKGLQLVVSDIEAAQAELAGRGVDVSPVRHVDETGNWVDGPGGDWNSFVFFDDPDGNSWAIQQKPA